MPACAWVHLYGGATRRAGGELAGAPIWRSRQVFFFFFPHSPLEQVHLYGEATLKSWGAVLLYALVCGMTNQQKSNFLLTSAISFVPIRSPLISHAFEYIFACEYAFRSDFRHQNFKKLLDSQFFTIDFRMWFSPQRRSIFHHNFQNSFEADVFYAFSLQNVLLAIEVAT